MSRISIYNNFDLTFPIKTVPFCTASNVIYFINPIVYK
jgi:hypothetical protein